jgi:hypothetical protein
MFRYRLPSPDGDDLGDAVRSGDPAGPPSDAPHVRYSGLKPPLCGISAYSVLR